MNVHGRLPEPVNGIDLKSLPIKPEEAFVFSRIDGVCTEVELANMTGLELDRVSQMLDRLAELGAIRFHESDAQSSPRGDIGPSSVANAKSTGEQQLDAGDQKDSIETAASLTSSVPAESSFELEPNADIGEERQRLILKMYNRLSRASYYELLDVPPDAEKKVIKAAYFETVNLFHPDRYYGKRLGSLKSKLERIFTNLTQAHDTLTKNQSRREYDAYLSAQQTTRRYDELLSETAQRTLLERTQQQIEDRARRLESSDPAASQGLGADAVNRADLGAPRAPRFSNATIRAIEAEFGAQPSSSNAGDNGAPPSQPRPLSSNPTARRQALARKLSQSRLAASGENTSPPLSREELRDHALDQFRHRYEQRLSRAKSEQVSQFVRSSETAIQNQDIAGAVNALRIAASLAPDDRELVKRLEQLQHQADRELQKSYAARAHYEERDGRWQTAARSYMRAARGSNDPQHYERAAFCLLQAEKDLKSARENAQRAVSLAPNVAGYRITLARVLFAAGMKNSARAELERAAHLAPNDDSIRDWLKRLEREAS